jgi:DNA polymerase-3 subunit beta
MTKIIKFNVDELVPQIAMASSVVSPNNALPILSCLRLETKTDGNGGTYLEIMASDGETWLQVKSTITEAETGIALCIAQKDFLQALRNLTGKFVTMNINDEKRIASCEYENGHFSLPYDDATEYPMPVQDTEQTISKRIDAARLLTAIEKAGFATANDELRPVMNGVHFDFKQDHMVAVASDGHKLAKHMDLTIKGIVNDPDSGFTLHKKPSHVLMNVLNRQMGDVKIMFNERIVIVNNTTFKLCTRLIEGRYPNYDAVIPKDNDKEAIIDKKAFVSALKRVLPMSNESAELVSLKLDNNKLTINSEDIDFSKSASEIVPCEYNNESITIGFKGSALLQMLTNISGDKVSLLLSDASRAGIIKEKDENALGYDYISLIMPMLVS